MSWSAYTLLEGNVLETPTEKSRVEFEKIIIDLNGRIILGNRLFRRNEEIRDYHFGQAVANRAAFSRTVLITTGQGTVIGLRYSGIWPFRQWDRLIPTTNDPIRLRQEPPTHFRRAFRLLLEIVFGSLYIVLFLLRAAFDGWNHTDSKR